MNYDGVLGSNQRCLKEPPQGMLGTPVVEWLSVGAHSTIWPIPAAERQMNRNLTQNPGWMD